jgi:hypothetical protein
MKTTDFKKLIKEAVREAIQEELKDILLEAVKSPKQVIRESYITPTPQTPIGPGIPAITMDKRQLYADIIGETALSFNSQDVAKFNPGVGYDPANGTLPEGELDMSQIMGLLPRK